MKLVKIECNHCGSTLDLDLEHLQAYCPYCGNKLLIDINNLDRIIESMEKTKREQIRQTEESYRAKLRETGKTDRRQYQYYEKVSDNNSNVMTLAILFGSAILVLLMLFIMALFE